MQLTHLLLEVFRNSIVWLACSRFSHTSCSLNLKFGLKITFGLIAESISSGMGSSPTSSVWRMVSGKGQCPHQSCSVSMWTSWSSCWGSPGLAAALGAPTLASWSMQMISYFFVQAELVYKLWSIFARSLLRATISSSVLTRIQWNPRLNVSISLRRRLSWPRSFWMMIIYLGLTLLSMWGILWKETIFSLWTLGTNEAAL